MEPNPKYSIFVGSTKQDLNRVRDKAINAILNAGHIPSGMELWAAGHIPTLDAISNHLEQCDMHLLFLGSRYGNLVRDDKSFTRWEYDESMLAGRPVIPFVLNDVEYQDQLCEETDAHEIENRHLLEKFRKDLRSNSLCGEFSLKHPESVRFDCANSINQIINDESMPISAGWIRASSEYGRKVQAVESNEVLQQILNRIYAFSTLTDRLDKGPVLKRFLGDFFWDVMFGRIKRKRYFNLFFESGSTLAYVSEKFEQRLESGLSNETNWKITTNNALTLLQLLLHTRLNVTPCPAGKPEDHYGAMFDEVLLRDPEAAPLKPRNLFPPESSAVKATVSTLNRSEKTKKLFLATASGLDLENPEPHFRGPHVGSHPNMLFKRAIFQTGQPVVLFLNGWKITGADHQFKLGHCFPVFGPDLSWKDAMQRYPVAICVSCGIPDPRTPSDEQGKNDLRQKLDDLRDLLQNHEELSDFRFDYAESIDVDARAAAFMIVNPCFEAIFPFE